MPKHRGLTSTEEQKILDLHNNLRKKVRNGEIEGLPTPISMPDMIWDKELAEEAQRSIDVF